ncbi:hypothetical protein NX722_23485 [Endozoicomonas gorgoniicola]|uniref:Uncharacterized protein n=1 Tax=Endozoicomonas gorgoniicola TaxID=1234144 RepID=A0ABT3N1M0_9GAMM|nr:hypothetical protein [Endozoicomonas gorgoniicola]MCW7555530.1 hypothetical protein [Endozoicomonas gorgoniicola]
MGTQQLVESVDKLTKSTTEMVDIVKERKQVLEDSAASAKVDAAKTAAGRQSTQENRDQSYNYYQQSLAQANRAKQISELDTVTDALRLAAVPAPDFHLPLISDLQIREGFGPADQIDVSAAQDGSTMVDLPTRSASFSRASTATYINKCGELTTAAIDEPRFEKQGMLIEGSSTNIHLFSETQSSYNDLSRVTKSDGSILFGKKTTKFTGDGSGSVQTVRQVIPVSGLTTGQEYTHSVWIRLIAGEAAIGLYESNANSSNDKSTLETLVPDGKWRRVSVTHTIQNDDSVNLQSQIRSANLNIAVEFEAFYSQVESLPFASSYIPTQDTAVTRASDILKVDAIYFPPTNSDYTYAINIHPLIDNLANYQVPVSLSDGVGTDREIIARIGKTWKSFGIHNNVFGRTDSGAGTLCVVLDETQKLYFGKSSFGGNSRSRGLIKRKTCGLGHWSNFYKDENWWGHLRDFRIWHKALTPEQVASLG